MVEVVNNRDSKQPETSLFCEIIDFVRSRAPEGQLPQEIITGALQVDPVALGVFTHIRERLAATSLQTVCATRTDPDIVDQVLEKLYELGVLERYIHPSDMPNFSWDGVYSINRNALRIGRQLNDKPVNFRKLPFLGALFRPR